MISWQYLAGMIDGDGSIGTTRTGKNKNIVGRVVVANTDARLLFALKESFGGTVSIREKGAKENWKPFGSIAWSNRQAEIILENILPYLIVKTEQAKLCLELIRMKNLSKSERYLYQKQDSINFPNRTVAILKPEIKEIEELFASQIKEMNRRGI